MPNIERLTTLLEYVEKLDPELIQMENFKCGTAACLMGHAVSVFPDHLKWDDEGIPQEIGFPERFQPGSHFFELDARQWTRIFDGFIQGDLAVSNLREHIERWSNNAEH